MCHHMWPSNCMQCMDWRKCGGTVCDGVLGRGEGKMAVCLEEDQCIVCIAMYCVYSVHINLTYLLLYLVLTPVWCVLS